MVQFCSHKKINQVQQIVLALKVFMIYLPLAEWQKQILHIKSSNLLFLNPVFFDRSSFWFPFQHFVLSRLLNITFRVHLYLKVSQGSLELNLEILMVCLRVTNKAN